MYAVDIDTAGVRSVGRSVAALSAAARAVDRQLDPVRLPRTAITVAPALEQFVALWHDTARSLAAELVSLGGALDASAEAMDRADELAEQRARRGLGAGTI